MNHKVAIPEEHWDGVFAPSACLSIETTVDSSGRVNAAAHATTVRVCHSPVYIALTVNDFSHTAENVEATGEFVVNIVSLEPAMLEKVRVVGLPFDKGLNELDRAGLHEMESVAVQAPRIAECKSHFECVVEWTKRWRHRVMVCGRVVAVSMDEDCYDPRGMVRWDKLRPAEYCGAPYGGNFVGAYEPLFGRNPYEGAPDFRTDLVRTTARSGVSFSDADGELDQHDPLADQKAAS